jgi:hypothetical protein
MSGEHGPRRLGEPFPRSSVVLLTVLAAVLFTCAVLFVDWPHSRANKLFVQNVWFLIWAILLCAQTSLWAVLAVPLWSSTRALRRQYRFGRRAVSRVVLSAAIVTFLIGVLVRFSYPAVPDYSFAHHRAKILVLTAAGFSVALLALVGMWLVEATLSPSFGGTLVEYLGLRARLRQFLGAAAAIIGAATLSTGGLRTAVLSNVKGANFPSEYVLYYGAYLSAVLLVAYAPAHLALRAAGQRLLDQFVPIPETPPGSWSDWRSERSAVEGLLELDVATGKTLQTGLAIATPFIGSAIGVLLGTRG